MGTGVAPLPTILLVDEEPAFRERIGGVLRREGFRVLVGADGREALARWQADAPDLVLLGDRLRVLGGVEVCRRIRRAGATPVVIVTAEPGEAAVLRAFAAGADDVLTRPFGPRELAVRLRAILRRVGLRPEQAGRRGVTTLGPVTLDPGGRELRGIRRAARLTGRETQILAALLAPPGRVVPYAQLGADPDGDDGLSRRAVQRHVTHLRRKLRAVAGRAVAIELVRDLGYRLVG